MPVDLLALARAVLAGIPREHSAQSARSPSRGDLSAPSSLSLRPQARRVRGWMPRRRAPRVPCHTCGRLPVGTFDDGSPRYDHGHTPDGETWWMPEESAALDKQPALALLMEHEEFTTRAGRTFERWTFVTWRQIGEARHPVEVTGVTGASDRRHDQWQAAVSLSPWCHIKCEDRDGKLIVAAVLPVSTLSQARVGEYLDDEYPDEEEPLDLVVEAAHVFMDMLDQEVQQSGPTDG